MFYADLHIHTLASDGSASPRSILEEARKAGLRALSFTDHESLEGYFQGQSEALRLGLELLPGVEMVSFFRGHELHLLGYDFDPRAPELNAALQAICAERNIIAREVICRLQAYGFNISWEQAVPLIPPRGVLGKNHILQLLRQAGYIRNRVETREFLRLYLAPGGLAYIPFDGNPLAQAIKLIHAAGGVAVLAHPALIGDKTILESILEQGLDGIEVFYYYLGDDIKTSIRYFYNLARKGKFLITGGSDFHGIYAPAKIGAMGVSAPMVTKLREYSKVKSKQRKNF